MPLVVPSGAVEGEAGGTLYGKSFSGSRTGTGREFCLGPTHEEVITDMVRRDVRSYRDLPLNLYQIQTKFRDEIRPRFGLMRGREFIMKDSYSFHATEECAEREYKNMHDAYCRIFEGCGLKFRAVEAETGSIGGSFSHEFMVLAETGEDAIASCGVCSYAANIERAGVRADAVAALSGAMLPMDRLSTPGKKSVEEVSAFLNAPKDKLIKTLIYDSDKGPVAALVRGDLELNEAKLQRALDAAWVRLADEALVRSSTGAPSGFAGPVGLKIKIIADHSIKGMVNGIAGANEADAHI